VRATRLARYEAQAQAIRLASCGVLAQPCTAAGPLAPGGGERLASGLRWPAGEGAVSAWLAGRDGHPAKRAVGPRQKSAGSQALRRLHILVLLLGFDNSEPSGPGRRAVGVWHICGLVGLLASKGLGAGARPVSCGGLTVICRAAGCVRAQELVLPGSATLSIPHASYSL
jgi:hypothetical protein